MMPKFRRWVQVIHHQPEADNHPAANHHPDDMTDDEFRDHLINNTKYGLWILQLHTEMMLRESDHDLFSQMVRESGDIIATMDKIICDDIISEMSVYMGRRFNGKTLVEPLDDLVFFDIFIYYLINK